MRVVATEYLSIDGVFEEPGQWSFPFFNDEASTFKWNELQASDALLLGRKTYEGFAAAWPAMSDPVGFADKMNRMPKYVVSSTLGTAGWAGSKLINGDVAKEMRKLRDAPGQDLLLSGSAQLFNAMQRENLIDLYRFMVHPIYLGKGARLFADANGSKTLRLTRTKTLSTGIVILEYEPVERA
jgi:dihydrofolate reductase